jgi:diguanylate cyclase (GGDEF)-like protein/PAS domain S-box-containing protein
VDKETTEIPAGLSSPEQIERNCMRNLLASPEERVWLKDLESRFLLVSQGWLEAVAPGRTLDDIIGRTDFDIFSRPHAAAAFEDERQVIATGKAIVAKIECETFDDRPDAWVSTTKLPLRDEDGAIIGTWGIARDVTAQISAEQALVQQALHDPVTGLANRVALMDRLQQALVSLERRAGRVAVLFVDLDDFKDINDAFGHDVGDRVLVEVGRRLGEVARRMDTVARLGGDEFVVLLSYLHDDADVRTICERISTAIRAPLHLEGRELSVSGSVGVAVSDDPLIDPGELVRRADVAMYGAKRAGRNRFEVFDVDTQLSSQSRAGLAEELVGAIERGELFVLYQPLFRLEDGSLSGAEALVRWLHPTRGVLPPAEFIPLAEERGLVGRIDSFVLEEACRQLAAWAGESAVSEEFVISVNVSGRQLRDRALVDRVRDALERHAIAPSRLCLEVTESALIGELHDANRVLASISELGVKIALDDFGSGYATLSHLQHVRADILKIDRSFIARLGGGTRDREIIAAVTAMAHALGMSVVGEGIETDHQLDNLVAMACDEGQGYVFAPPLAPAEIVALHGAAAPPAVASSARSGGRARARRS